MQPFDDFETILSNDYGDGGNAGDEMLQRNGTLGHFTAENQRAELSRIAVWKTTCEKKPFIKIRRMITMIS